jgi:methylmalonyl-CoA mutase N-terminal domain/subunit
VDENFFEEIAKFRAARRIWARLMQEEFNTTNPRSCALRMAVQSTGRIFTAQQPYINLMRGAFQSLAAVLGGCQSLNTDTLDEALGIPQPIASELALRTQQIVAYETRVTDTIDPLAGSYYVESLTKAIEGRVHEYMEKLDALGGPLEALEKGFFEKEWTEASLKYTNDIMDGKKTRIGVNKFVKTDGDDHEFHPFRVPPHYEEIQADRVRKLRQERDNAEYEAALDKIRGLARREENVIPGIAEALEADATIGEISDVLREFYGAYQPHSVR